MYQCCITPFSERFNLRAISKSDNMPTFFCRLRKFPLPPLFAHLRRRCVFQCRVPSGGSRGELTGFASRFYNLGSVPTCIRGGPGGCPRDGMRGLSKSWLGVLPNLSRERHKKPFMFWSHGNFSNFTLFISPPPRGLALLATTTVLIMETSMLFNALTWLMDI